MVMWRKIADKLWKYTTEMKQYIRKRTIWSFDLQFTLSCKMKLSQFDPALIILRSYPFATCQKIFGFRHRENAEFFTAILATAIKVARMAAFAISNIFATYLKSSKSRW
jgi:hypothetical protein